MEVGKKKWQTIRFHKFCKKKMAKRKIKKIKLKTWLQKNGKQTKKRQIKNKHVDRSGIFKKINIFFWENLDIWYNLSRALLIKIHRKKNAKKKKRHKIGKQKKMPYKKQIPNPQCKKLARQSEIHVVVFDCCVMPMHSTSSSVNQLVIHLPSNHQYIYIYIYIYLIFEAGIQVSRFSSKTSFPSKNHTHTIFSNFEKNKKKSNFFLLIQKKFASSHC